MLKSFNFTTIITIKSVLLSLRDATIRLRIFLQ